MRIFSNRNKRKGDTADLQLVQIPEKKTYDVYAVIAKALVVFMLVYGAMGGFLSAYGIDYNKSVCMLAIFFFSLIFSAVYETGKRWATNLLNILVFLLYLFLALRSFWIINSGCYAVMNRVLEVARDYLGLAGGTEYALAVEDTYNAVTYFVLFIGMVGTILFNIQMQNKVSLLKTLVMTLPLYGFPLYFERTPGSLYLIFLLSGYMTIAVLHDGNIRENIPKQMRYVLPIATILVVVLVRLIYFCLPQDRYNYTIPMSVSKKNTEDVMSNFAQYGMMTFFLQKYSGAGISGGFLSRGSAVMPDYETDLIVRFTPYSRQPVYLKAFTGKDYDGNRWSAAGEEWPEDSGMITSVLSREEAWKNRDDKMQSKGVMEVKNVGASARYQYQPYYSMASSTLPGEHGVRYDYYPLVTHVDVARETVDSGYLYVPENCRNAVRKACVDAGLSGTDDEIALQIVTYFRDNYSYSLRPGFAFGSTDYISHFLQDTKKGYCAHFASAATMMFRYMGIPARYVEGYAFSYSDVVNDGKLVEDAVYEDYYDGYSPLGKTGLIELEVPDANAHGWVEIYVDGSGWIVVDPTPAAEDEETASFWDAFLRMDNEGSDNGLNFGGGAAGEYIEKGIKGITWIVLAVLLAVMLISLLKWMIRRKREANLTERQKAQLEYRRLTERLGRKSREFRPLRTIREQMRWLEHTYGIEVSEELTEWLYAVFFAGDDADVRWDEVRRSIGELHRSVRLKRIKSASIDKKAHRG